MASRQVANAGAFPEAAESSELSGPRRRRFARLNAGSLLAARGLAGLIVLTALLGFWHLDRYPRTWFDEGSYLEVARNVAERGSYVAEAPDGTLDFAPTIAVGPTVLLPAAASQAAWGTSLAAGRFVGVLYLILATAALYLLARRLFGPRAALFCAAVLFAMPALDWLGTGRQLLGEAPAVFFLVAGAALAFRGSTLRIAVAAGLVMGLALMTKGQYLLVLPATICAVALFDYRGARLRSLRWYGVLLGVALGVYGAWLGALLALIGEGDIVENYRLLRQSSGGALLVFDLDRMRAAWTLLLGPRSLLLVLPAALYGLIIVRRTGQAERRLALASLWIFQTFWLGWFASASIAWPRYAFAGLAINALFAGAMLSDLFGVFWERDRGGVRFVTQRARAAAALLAVVAVLLLAGGYHELAPVVGADEREPRQFASALDRAVPAGAVVDGWEPEINFLSDREMQYPPPGSLDRVVRASWLGSSEDVDLSATLAADYLVIGHFGRWVGVYDAALDSGQYRLIADVDGYELYERLDAR